MITWWQKNQTWFASQVSHKKVLPTVHRIMNIESKQPTEQQQQQQQQQFADAN